MLLAPLLLLFSKCFSEPIIGDNFATELSTTPLEVWWQRFETADQDVCEQLCYMVTALFAT